jgi:DNA mismatch endonuclease (patch repair protein)
MVDHLDVKARSINMSHIKSKNTKPEIRIRNILRVNGLKFRTNDKKLPGKPDIVLTEYQKIVLVHGCFWHRHKNCKRTTVPKTNTAYWRKKFKDNQERDKRIKRKLLKLGYKVFVIWECQIRDKNKMSVLIYKIREK